MDTTSFRKQPRDIATIIALMIWVVASYLMTVMIFFGYAANAATWGGPDWNRVWVVMAAMVPTVLFGWLWGMHLKHWMTPLFVSLVMVAFHLGPVTFHNARTQRGVISRSSEAGEGLHWERLAPVAFDHSGEMWKLLPLFVIWMLALALLLWVMHCTLSAPSIKNGVQFVFSLLIGGTAAFVLVVHDPVPSQSSMAQSVQPVCASRLDGAITVCLHPADESLLDETADVIAEVISPVVGLPGVASRYQAIATEGQANDVLQFSIWDMTSLDRQVPYGIARRSVWTPSISQPRLTAPQAVIGAWLLDARRYEDLAGSGFFPPVWTLDEIFPYRDDEALVTMKSDIHAAIDRFSALPPDEQRAWLEANWDALRAGELTLEDLP